MTQDTTEILKREDIHQHTKAVCVLLDALQEIENLATYIRDEGRDAFYSQVANRGDKIIDIIDEARAATKALNKETR